jgi:FkbM family methyltransferase
MSQLAADEWVLGQFGKNGFFLDVGCGDGVFISNTFELEKNGWKGICIDAFPKNFESRPNSQVVQACVSAKSGDDVKFIISENQPELSGIYDKCTVHMDTILKGPHSIVDMKTKTLEEILDECKAPTYIEYLNLDIEGSELDILNTFNFNKYEFGIITVEWNIIEDYGIAIYEKLESVGYHCCCRVAWDLWFINKKVNFDQELLVNVATKMRKKLNP